METITQESIDLGYIKMASGGDTDFEQEMIGSMIIEIDEKMQSLRLHLSVGDVDNTRIAAHSLKNLYSILGVAALAEQCKNIEHACDGNTLNTSLMPLYLQCEVNWQKSKEQLKQALAAY